MIKNVSHVIACATRDIPGKQESHSIPPRFPRSLRTATGLALGVVLVGCSHAAPEEALSSQASLSDGVQSGSVVLLTNACTGKAVDVGGVSQDNGATVIQWTKHGGLNQQWKLSATDSGYYKLIAKHSNKALNVANSSSENGSIAEQTSDDGAASQQWKLIALGDDRFKLTPRHAPNKALDLDDASTTDGAKIQIWDDLGGCAQAWKVQTVTAATADTPAATPSDLSDPLE